jgi:hypothetical protein
MSTLISEAINTFDELFYEASRYVYHEGKSCIHEYGVGCRLYELFANSLSRYELISMEELRQIKRITALFEDEKSNCLQEKQEEEENYYSRKEKMNFSRSKSEKKNYIDKMHYSLKMIKSIEATLEKITATIVELSMLLDYYSEDVVYERNIKNRLALPILIEGVQGNTSTLRYLGNDIMQREIASFLPLTLLEETEDEYNNADDEYYDDEYYDEEDDVQEDDVQEDHVQEDDEY